MAGRWLPARLPSTSAAHVAFALSALFHPTRARRIAPATFDATRAPLPLRSWLAGFVCRYSDTRSTVYPPPPSALAAQRLAELDRVALRVGHDRAGQRARDPLDLAGLDAAAGELGDVLLEVVD